MEMEKAQALEKVYNDYLQKLYISDVRSQSEQTVGQSFPASPYKLQGVSCAPPQLPAVSHALSQLQGVSSAPPQLPVVSHASSLTIASAHFHTS